MAPAPPRIGLAASLVSPQAGDTLALQLALQLAHAGVHVTLLRGAAGLPVDAAGGDMQRGTAAKCVPVPPVAADRLLPCRLLGLQQPAPRGAIAPPDACPASGGQWPFPVLRALGDRLAPPPADDAAIAGSPDVGVAGFHRADFTPDALQQAARWLLLLSGSSWSTQVLRAHGLRNVQTWLPGIDLQCFQPAAPGEAPPAALAGRFAVFAGGASGPLEGRDIVLAAFQAFRHRHPQALLLVDAPAGAGLAEGCVALGERPPAQRAQWLRHCALAVFPARCAALVPHAAMEALACGVPVVLAGHTGLLDLVGEHAYVLKDGRAPDDDASGGQGGLEYSPDELLALMERAHRRRAEAAHKGRRGARFIRDLLRRYPTHALMAVLRQPPAGLAPAAQAQDDYRWGLCLHRAGRLADAAQVYDTLVRVTPASAAVHVCARIDRGHARRDLGDTAGAEADFRAALQAQPRHAHALQCLGNLLRQNGRAAQAVEPLQQAAASPQATPSMHWDLAFTLLQLGRYAQAWPHFAFRHAALGLRTLPPSRPLWDGRDVAGMTLLVLDEQGLGDTLQFLRFLPRIARGAGGRVVFAGKPAALPVVRRLLPAEDVFSWDAPLPRSQCWVPLMSLPQKLGIATPDELPAPLDRPLLQAQEIAQWEPRVRAGAAGPVVGMCWQGNPDFSGDARRSPGLAPLRPLLDVAGVRFVSLQVGQGRNEIAALGLQDRLADVGGSIEAAGAQVMDTLAALQSCDFVVSSCTSVAHMAGLTGRPGWVLLGERPDWRWMLTRDDTPWYPSLTLMRQQAPGQWNAMVARLCAELALRRDALHLPCRA